MKTVKITLLILLIIATSCKNLSFTPGTYSTEAQGYGGVIKADVIFSEDSLKSVVITQHNETQFIGDIALTSLIERMVEANGTGVDAVSGATATSDGLKELVKNAAKMAGKNNL